MNNFYLLNSLHDIAYRVCFCFLLFPPFPDFFPVRLHGGGIQVRFRLPFASILSDPISSSFQKDNFGNGGEQGDRVTASIQDSAGTDNADFSTPPDGQSGHMRMYLFTSTSPQRDGALENDIPSHEYTHGGSRFTV